MQKLMGDEGWGGGGLFFSTDPKCLCVKPVDRTYDHYAAQAHRLLFIELHLLDNGPTVRLHAGHLCTYMSSSYDLK